MYIKGVFVVALCYLFSLTGFGQPKTEITTDPCTIPKKERKVLHIQEVVLKDTFLIKQIEILIQEWTQQDSIFRIGQGYIEMYANMVFADQVDEKNIWRSYYISAQFAELRKTENDPVFPSFYTNVAGRLVLIKINFTEDIGCYRYSRKSKKALIKKLEPFMPLTSKEVARDVETGKVAWRDRKFRFTRFSFHNGKYIYFYTDKPPKVFIDPY